MADVRKIENLLLRAVRLGLYFLLFTPFVITTSTMYPFVHGKVFYFLVVSEIVFWLYFTLCLVNKKYRPGFRGVNFAALVFVGALFVTSLFGVNFERSFWGNLPKMLGLFEVIHVFLIFLVLGSLAREKEFRDKFIFAVFLMGIFLGVLGAIQSVVPSFLGTGWGGRRIGVTFDNPDYYGSIVIFPLFFGIYLFLQSSGWKKVFILSGTFLLAFNLFFTQARATIVAAVAGIIFVAAYFLFKKIYGSEKLSKTKIFAVIFFLIFVSGAGIFAVNRFGGGRFAPQTLYRDLTQSARTLAWEAALRGFWTHKLFGWGYGNFNVVYDTFYKPEMLRFSHEETQFDSSHNIFLDYLSLGGLIAAAAFFYLIFNVGKNILGIKKIDGSFAVIFGTLLLVYFAQGMLIFDTLFSLFLFFVVLALSVSFLGGAKESAYPKAGVWKATSAIVFVFVLLIMNGTVFSWARASAAARNMSVSFNKGSGREAATFWDVLDKNSGPFRREYSVDSAVAVINFSRNYADWDSDSIFGRAEELFDGLAAAARNHPGDVRYSSTVGELGVVLSQKNNSIAERAKGVLIAYLEKNLNRQEIYYPLIRLNIISGNLSEAKNLSDKVLALDDRIRESHYYAAMVAFAGGDDARGFAELERAIKLGYPIEDPAIMLIGASYWGDRGDYRKVESFLKKAITVYPTSQLYTMLAATEARLGDKPAAITAVRHAVMLNPALRSEALQFLQSIGVKVINN